MISSSEIFMEEREGEEIDYSQEQQTMEDQNFLSSIETIPQLLQDTTKEDRANFVSNVITRIENGEVDALKIQLQLKSTESMMEMFSDVKKFPNTASRYKDLLMTAAERYGKKFTLHNSEFQIKEAGVSYNYEQCNDPEITALHSLLKTVKADVKIREDFLKTVPAKGLQVLDSSTGELNTIYPPSKSSVTTLQTTLR